MLELNTAAPQLCMLACRCLPLRPLLRPAHAPVQCCSIQLLQKTQLPAILLHKRNVRLINIQLLLILLVVCRWQWHILLLACGLLALLPLLRLALRCVGACRAAWCAMPRGGCCSCQQRRRLRSRSVTLNGPPLPPPPRLSFFCWPGCTASGLRLLPMPAAALCCWRREGRRA